jgi:hypothetical protein
VALFKVLLKIRIFSGAFQSATTNPIFSVAFQSATKDGYF